MAMEEVSFRKRHLEESLKSVRVLGAVFRASLASVLPSCSRRADWRYCGRDWKRATC